MKKGILLGVVGTLALSSTVFAEATSSVTVNNSVNNSTSTTTTNNGETKVFESTGQGVDYTSPDGKTTVKINNNGSTTTDVSKNTQETVEKVKEEVKGAVENSKKEIADSIQKNKADTEKIVADEVENRAFRIFHIIKDFFISLIPK
ncbi:MAG TPA: hypothetical protein PLD54_01365 [Candidatus Levybacteria bacterium]|nr:hypothetical protein [Candidatus Levybacteria bacterium]